MKQPQTTIEAIDAFLTAVDEADLQAAEAVARVSAAAEGVRAFGLCAYWNRDRPSAKLGAKVVLDRPAEVYRPRPQEATAAAPLQLVGQGAA